MNMSDLSSEDIICENTHIIVRKKIMSCAPSRFVLRHREKLGFTTLKMYRLFSDRAVIPTGMMKKAGLGTGATYRHSVFSNYEIGVETDKSFKKRSALWAYQKDIVASMVSELREQVGSRRCASLILTLEPGMGKTRIAIAVAMSLHIPIAVVVPTKFIQKQWLGELSTCANVRVDKKHGDGIFEDWAAGAASLVNGRKQAESLQDSAPEIFITTINTATMIKPVTWRKVGCVIYDEIHSYCTKKYSEVFFNCGSMIQIGLTATLARLDGFEQLLKKLFWKVVSADTKQAPVKQFFVDVIKLEYFCGSWIEPQYREDGVLDYHALLTNVMSDKKRIDIITLTVAKLLRGHFNVYVFSEFIEYLQKIQDSIARLHANVVMFTGGNTEPLEKMQQLQNCVVLTTYKYSEKGISLQQMTASILTTPRKNGLKQICGRIMRQGSKDDGRRIIIDIVDMRSLLKSQYRHREEIYKTINANIVIQKLQ